MHRLNRALALALIIPLALGAAACGGDADRSALEDDELDRELELALQGDTSMTTFEDTAVADAEPEDEEASPAAPRTEDPVTPQPRPRQPEPEPESPRQEQPRQPQPRTVTQTIPAGTTVALRMNESLSTESTRSGDAFTARLEDPIVDATGAVMVPAGATVRGRVTAVSPSTRVGQTAAIKLAFEAISFDGESYPLEATIQSADVQQQGRTSTAESAGKVAVGAAAGAILGQVLGKDRESTLAGAAIGAAAGTAVAMGTADVDAVLPENAEVVIRVDRPITITRTVSG